MRSIDQNPARSHLAIEATAYARGGWHIHPLRPRGKEPLTAHGFKDATNDVEQVERWWADQPLANIGLHCRHFTVLDIDPRNGGDETLESLVGQHGAGFKDTVNVLTGGGGVHYYYLGTTSVTKAGQGIDVKSSGGYVVLPPSVHPSGGEYVWEYSPDDTDMLDLPDWLKYSRSPETARIYEQSPIPAGQRNDMLIRIAGRLRGIDGYISDTDGIEGMLTAINNKYCDSPLGADEVRQIVQSAKRWKPGTRSEAWDF